MAWQCYLYVGGPFKPVKINCSPVDLCGWARRDQRPCLLGRCAIPLTQTADLTISGATGLSLDAGRPGERRPVRGSVQGREAQGGEWR